MSYKKEREPYDCSNLSFTTLFKQEWEKYLPASMRYGYYVNKYFSRLKHVRGKVVLFDHYNNFKDYTLGKGFGWIWKYMENTWKDVTYSTGTITSSYKSKLKTHITKSMNAVGNFKSIYITYTSANDCGAAPYVTGWINRTPYKIAMKVNPFIEGYLRALNVRSDRFNKKNFGVVAMDYPNHGLVDEIIKRNPGTSDTHFSSCSILHLKTSVHLALNIDFIISP